MLMDHKNLSMEKVMELHSENLSGALFQCKGKGLFGLLDIH